MFTEIAANSSATDVDRAGARRELGLIGWLAHGKTDAAAAAITEAPPGEESCLTATLALRVFREAGNPSIMLARARNALTACAPTDVEHLRVEIARADLAAAYLAPTQRAALLGDAQVQFAGLTPIGRKSPAASAARLSVAIARRDAETATSAWRDYFWLTSSDVPQAMQIYAGRISSLFTLGLAPQANDGDLIALMDMLIRAGFTADAQALATETAVAGRAVDNPDWRATQAYLNFDRFVREATLRADRELANGGHALWYEASVRGAIADLMRDDGLSGNWQTALAQPYGLYGRFDETSGFPNLRVGHIMQDERVRVTQYGGAGEFRFVVLDNMLSNGYQSWLWDGWAETGGWTADGPTVVQVRSAYTEAAITDFSLITNSDARDQFQQEIEREAPAEREALAAGAIVSLPSTSKRLKLQALDEIAARVGTSDDALLPEVWRAILQHSIFIHEGRHVLDRTVFRSILPRMDNEYRAKLSELALADYPRLPLASISGGQVGDGTEHGSANARILTAFRVWIQSHESDIAGYDAALPALSQLPLLSNDQIRTVARALDPAAQ